jgi:sugar phosphate isomerase/epimerase
LEINYCCPHWGSEQSGIAAFFDRLKTASYNGVEIFLSDNIEFVTEFMAELGKAIDSDSRFKFIIQHIAPHQPGPVKNYIDEFERRLLKLTDLKPDFINAHTGKDFFSFDDNCRVIEAAMNISSKTGVRILHETHRGRFSFHSASLIPYLKRFPEMELVGDFSHFCTVSESLLQDQEEIINQIIPQVSHIHARIGQEQAPQVNDPFAPEWKNHLTLFEGWWAEIIAQKKEKGWSSFTITPEFGPSPYMPLLPFTLQPIGNQWDINQKMMHHLRDVFNGM